MGLFRTYTSVITTAWVVSGAGEMPVPSTAFPAKLKDDRSFAGADELDVRSLVGRDEELESLSSYSHPWVSKGRR